MCVFLSAVEEASTSGFCHGSRQTARQTVHSAVQLELPDNTTADIIYVFMSCFFEILLNSFLELERWWDSTRGSPAADIISPWVYTFAKVEKPKQATQQILQQTQRISEHETWTNQQSLGWCQNSFVSCHPFFDKIRPTWFSTLTHGGMAGRGGVFDSVVSRIVFLSENCMHLHKFLCNLTQ